MLALQSIYGEDYLGSSSVLLLPGSLIPVSHQLFVTTSFIALLVRYQAEADDVSVSVLVLVAVNVLMSTVDKFFAKYR